MTFRFIPLGVGDAFSKVHYTFCIAIGATDDAGQERWILVDCPHPIRKIVHEGTRDLSASGALAKEMDVHDFEAVLLSHLHADHASGLEGYSYMMHFMGGERAKLIAHPKVVEPLWDRSLYAGMAQLLHLEDYPELDGPEAIASFKKKQFGDFFQSIPLSDTQSVRYGPFEIETYFTIHHIPTTAFRIKANGRTLSISADTAFDPGLIEWLNQGDLVIHETGYGVHTPYEKLVSLDEKTRKKMRLIHFPDTLDIDPTLIEPLKEGALYEV